MPRPTPNLNWAWFIPDVFGQYWHWVTTSEPVCNRCQTHHSTILCLGTKDIYIYDWLNPSMCLEINDDCGIGRHLKLNLVHLCKLDKGHGGGSALIGQLLAGQWYLSTNGSDWRRAGHWAPKVLPANEVGVVLSDTAGISVFVVVLHAAGSVLAAGSSTNATAVIRLDANSR